MMTTTTTTRMLTLTPECNARAVEIIAQALPKALQHKIGTWLCRQDVSVGEAAKVLGTNDRSLRRRIEAGQVPVYQNEAGNLRVALYPSS